ncbi:MAG TPA: hypothetical protein VES65_01475 [Solirubrobacteraceae bacterium]|nr:hypothetical protein [Solirubrobacteraceae bacterium]
MLRVIRAAAAISAVTLAGASLGACGEGHSTTPRTSSSSPSATSSNPSATSPTGTTPSTPSATPSTPSTTPSTGSRPPKTGEGPRAGRLLTRSQAVAFAQAVNLQPKDVPGFVVASSERQQGAGEGRLEREMLRCTGVLSGHSELAEADSKEYEHTDRTGTFGVSSSVSVARTPAIAAEGLSATRSEHAQGCLSHALSPYVGRGARITGLSVHSEAASAPGASGGVVLRITANVAQGARPLPINLDLFGFVCGQAQIGLFTTSLPGSFPPKARQRLLAVLLARAKAHGECAAAHPSGASTALAQ